MIRDNTNSKLNSFNEHFLVPNSAEHLNILLDNDIEAFIDPYLASNSLDNPIAKEIFERSKRFLEILHRDYISLNRKHQAIIFLSHLREANEYHLGYSEDNKGKGVGPTKAKLIFDSLMQNEFATGQTTITHAPHHVLLLVAGIGQDNMSDILANVCRDIFSKFTFNQCLKFNIPTHDVRIEYFDETQMSWNQKLVKLPIYEGKPIILVPSSISSGERIYHNHYNWYVSSKHISADILSGRINTITDRYILTSSSGARKAIIKNINEDFKKAKKDLGEHVKKYNGSLLGFQDHAKSHYPPLANDKLAGLYNKAS